MGNYHYFPIMPPKKVIDPYHPYTKESWEAMIAFATAVPGATSQTHFDGQPPIIKNPSGSISVNSVNKSNYEPIYGSYGPPRKAQITDFPNNYNPPEVKRYSFHR